MGTTRKEQLDTPKFAVERRSITNGAGFVWCSGLTEPFLFEHCVSGKKKSAVKPGALQKKHATARVHLGHSVPMTFHGTWVQD
jgi:hypothetical protein